MLYFSTNFNTKGKHYLIVSDGLECAKGVSLH